MSSIQHDEHFMLTGIEQREPTAVWRAGKEGLPKRNKPHLQHKKGLDSFAGQRTKNKYR